MFKKSEIIPEDEPMDIIEEDDFLEEDTNFENQVREYIVSLEASDFRKFIESVTIQHDLKVKCQKLEEEAQAKIDKIYSCTNSEKSVK